MWRSGGTKAHRDAASRDGSEAVRALAIRHASAAEIDAPLRGGRASVELGIAAVAVAGALVSSGTLYAGAGIAERLAGDLRTLLIRRAWCAGIRRGVASRRG